MKPKGYEQIAKECVMFWLTANGRRFNSPAEAVDAGFLEIEDWSEILAHHRSVHYGKEPLSNLPEHLEYFATPRQLRSNPDSTLHLKAMHAPQGTQ